MKEAYLPSDNKYFLFFHGFVFGLLRLAQYAVLDLVEIVGDDAQAGGMSVVMGNGVTTKKITASLCEEAVMGRTGFIAARRSRKAVD